MVNKCVVTNCYTGFNTGKRNPPFIFMKIKTYNKNGLIL